MVTSVSAEQRTGGEITSTWWVFLVTGIFWLLVAFGVFRFDAKSLASIGTLLGAVLLLAGVNEFLASSARRRLEGFPARDGHPLSHWRDRGIYPSHQCVLGRLPPS
jgi:uncharacterized membrane protein HdeD (DUF308 family)